MAKWQHPGYHPVADGGTMEETPNIKFWKLLKVAGSTFYMYDSDEIRALE